MRAIENPPKLLVVAGICALDHSHAFDTSIIELIASTLDRHINLVLKGSVIKANRTSGTSFRGVGLEAGMPFLQRVRKQYSVHVTTDIHETWQAPIAADTVDLLQIPALLSRQTPLLEAAGRTGLPVNIKKGQFMPPAAMRHAVEKVRATGNDQVFITERGTTFGHGDLVVDFRGMVDMREFAPVIFDATHSVQRPANGSTTSGGNWEYTIHLARAAAAMGVDGIFFETHPDPDRALCDGDIAWPLDRLDELVDAILDAWRPPEPKEWTMPVIGSRSSLSSEWLPHNGDGTLDPEDVEPTPGSPPRG